MNIRLNRNRTVLCRKTDGQTEMTKLIVIFRFLAKAPKNYDDMILYSGSLGTTHLPWGSFCRAQNYTGVKIGQIKITCAFSGWRRALLSFLTATSLNNSCVQFVINNRNSAFWNMEKPTSFKNSFQIFYTKQSKQGDRVTTFACLIPGISTPISKKNFGVTFLNSTLSDEINCNTSQSYVPTTLKVVES